MTVTSDSVPPNGHVSSLPDARVRRLGRLVGKAAAAIVSVIAAAGLGWWLAGVPADGAAVVPPACPAFFVPQSHVGSEYLAGDPGQLVPMPLPEPRGPVSARICRYQPGPDRRELRVSVAVDPVRTAALAGLMNERPVNEQPDAVAGSASTCSSTPGTDVLIFRYTKGLPLRVDVRGGDGAQVRTPARTESGRRDVVHAVGELVCAVG